MLDKQIQQLDKAYQKQIKGGVRIRHGHTQGMEGTLTEKLITPGGAHVLCFSDGRETVSVFVSEPIFARYDVGQRCEISYNGHSLIGLCRCEEDLFCDTSSFEQQTVTVTVRTWGEPCDLTDEQIAKWYRERIESLLDPDIGKHEVSVSVERTAHR